MLKFIAITALALCVTNFLPAQTATLLKDINPGVAHALEDDQGAAINTVISDGQKIFFFAKDTGSNLELWVSNGTNTGTYMVKDINGNPATASLSYRDIAFYKGKVYFAANDGTNGHELWVSDGTAAGTKMLKDIVPGIGSAAPSKFRPTDSGLFFLTASASSSLISILWVTDGTEAGTRKVTDAAGSEISIQGGCMGVGNKLIFTKKILDPTILITDGTGAGTLQIGSIPGFTPTADLDNAFFHNNKIYFAANKNAVFISNGNANNLQGIYSSSSAISPSNFHPFGNQVFFTSGQALHATDGTPNGTQLAVNSSTSNLPSYKGLLTSTPSQLVFSMKNGSDFVLNSFDGSSTKIAPPPAGSTQIITPTEAVAVGETVYFVATDDNGKGLFKTDFQTTERLTEIIPNTGGNPRRLQKVGNHLIFVLNDPTVGRELFALSLLVGTGETPMEKVSLEIAPNPASDIVRVKIPKKAVAEEGQIIVFNANGQFVWQAFTEGELAEIPITLLSKGVYFIEFRSQKGFMGHTKFLKI